MTKKPSPKTAKSPTSLTQKELAIAVVLALLLGFGGGYGIKYLQTEDVITTTPQETTPHSHMMNRYEVPADQAPTVELIVAEDAKSGYNISIITTNFTFTPRSVNEENVAGEGHAHLYVDGEKIGRLYGNYYHYDENFEGTKTFRVELNANDHSVYAVDGEPIQTEVTVTHNSDSPTHKDSH